MTFFRKFNHHCKCGEQKKHFQKIPIIKFCNFFDVLVQVHQSPQVKRNLISSITGLVKEFPHELPNDLRRRIPEN